MPAPKKYEGPYEVIPVFWDYGEEIEGYQVVSKVFYLPGNDQPHRTVNSQIYEDRQSAYRRCAQLNQRWQEKHRE